MSAPIDWLSSLTYEVTGGGGFPHAHKTTVPWSAPDGLTLTECGSETADCTHCVWYGYWLVGREAVRDLRSRAGHVRA